MVCIMSTAKSTSEESTFEILDDEKDSVTEESTSDGSMKIEILFGGSISDSKPLFSMNGESLFISQGNTVLVYSVKTGEQVKKFENVQSSLVNIEFDLESKTKDILIGCTETGQIVRWKSKKGTVIKKTQMKLPVAARVSAFGLTFLENHDGLKAAVIHKIPNQRQKLDFFDVETGEKIQSFFHYELTKEDVKLKISQQFNLLAISQEHRIYITNLNTWKSNRLISAYKNIITCLEFHPEEEMIATGDETGKIYLWRQLFQNLPLTDLYHWHHTRVNSIEFSESGSTMLSSGNESVLVKWALNKRHDKVFFPRLPGNGVCISVSPTNSQTAITLEDNSILIIGDDNLIENTLQLSSIVNTGKTNLKKFPVGFKLNPRNQSIVFNGRKGQLQFVSTYNKSLLYNMDIVIQNRLSDETEQILYDIRVTAADINIDWLATGEEFNDFEHTPELRLKFWEYQKDTQNYALNTNFELPHTSGFRTIKFSNSHSTDDLLCATVGLDNILKIWSLEDSDNIYKQGKTWACVKKIAYKNQAIESVSFSSDGSLLAAGFANNLCIFKTKSLQLKCVLTPPASFSGLFQECFVSLQNKSSKTANKRNIYTTFSNSIETGDNKFVQTLSADKSSLKIINETHLNIKGKQDLYKQILQCSDLGFYQKIVTFKNLCIPCKISDKKLSSTLAQRFKTNQINLASKLKLLSKRNQFKGKYKIKKLFPGLPKCDEVTTFLKFLNISKKKSETNGFENGTSKTEEKSKTNVTSKLQKVVKIKHICFCSAEYAHLVVVCTEHRVFIWNLLNFRLTNILKLSVEHLAFDPITNLIACFTKYNELYVFLPNTPMPVYFKKGMPNIEGAIWVPRRYPQSQSLSVNWQALSNLYFLTEKQEFAYLTSTQDNNEHMYPYVAHNEVNSSGYSVFGALSAIKNRGVITNLNKTLNFTGNPEKGAVKTVTEMAAHTMPPLKTFCNKFINSMIHIRQNTNLQVTNKSNSTTEVNGYGADRLTEENYDENSDDEDDTFSLGLSSSLLKKSENIKQKSTEYAKTKDEKILQFVSKTKVDLSF